jgi:hypothetical protein
MDEDWHLEVIRLTLVEEKESLVLGGTESEEEEEEIEESVRRENERLARESRCGVVVENLARSRRLRQPTRSIYDDYHAAMMGRLGSSQHFFSVSVLSNVSG